MNTHTLTLDGKRVLLIEENDDLYRALSDTLVEAGCEVLGVTGFMGWSMVPTSSVDVVVLDVMSHRAGRGLAHDLALLDVSAVFIAADGVQYPFRFRQPQYLRAPFTQAQFLGGVHAALLS